MPLFRRTIQALGFVLLAMLVLPGLNAYGSHFPTDTTKAHNMYLSAMEKLEGGEYKEAGPMFEEASRLFRKRRFWERAIECQLLEINARSLNADEDGLIEYCKASLDFSEEKLGSNHPLTGTCLNRLGELYLHAHKHDMAGQSFENALRVYSSGGKAHSLSSAKVYSNMASLKMNLSQYDSAAIFVQKALDIQLELLDSLDIRLLPTYNTYGVLQYYLGHMDQAIQYFDKTLQIRMNAFGAMHPEVASSYNNLGSAYEKKKEFQQAVDLHENALNIRRTTLDSLHPNIALSLNNLANAWYGLGQYEKSNGYHFEALRLRRKIYGENHRAVAMSYANIGHNLLLQDNPDKATYYFKKVVPVMIDLYGPDHLLTSDAYENLGLPFYYAGAYDSAYYYLTKALIIREKIQDGMNLSAARSYNNIGALYKENRDYELALSYYEKSAEIYVTLLGEHCNLLSGSYNNMGEVYLEMGQLEKSFDYFKRSLEIDQANLGPENPRLAARYLNLGAAAAEMGLHEESLAYNQKALHLHIEAYGENNRLASSIYANLAMDYVELDSLDMALSYLNHAIEILHTFYDKPHFNLSSLHTKKGELLMEIGDWDQASKDLYQGLTYNHRGEINHDQLDLIDIDLIIDKNQFIESLLALIRFNESKPPEANPPEAKQGEILAKNLVIYQLIADISIKLRETYRLERSKLQALQKWDFIYSDAFETAVALHQLTGDDRYYQTAFRFAGLKKAKALTDAMLMAQAMENSSIPDSVIHLEKILHSRLEGHRQTLLELDPSAENAQKIADIEKEINSLIIELNELYLLIEKTYPDYNSLRSSYPQYMPDEIGDMLDSETLLLDFIISDSHIYSLVIGKNGRWIEKTALPDDFRKTVSDLLRAIRRYRSKDFIALSTEVYDVILNPLEKYFEDVKKIIIIPDQYLLLLPFEILVKQEGTTDNMDLGSQNYFVKQFQTVSHYATDLWVRSHQHISSKDTEAKTSGFLGFAPVFDNLPAPDQSGLAVTSPVENGSVLTLREVVDRMSLQELPHSAAEVEGIVSLFRQSGNKAQGMLRAQATEERFRATSGSYKYLHIATHGLINPLKPELSGLVFWKEAPGEDDPGSQLLIARKENDGVIYTKEVYDLNLNADLVTLSACETGAGVLAQGEGLLSFVRGFTYAGIPNMLISLWKVNDLTTASFMMDFYHEVLSGESYPSALRKAKLEAISKPETAFPAFWGNFVLIGH
jgi:CHAT domain-containing protein/tetratricopeptide (TPR) repeat protein